jgi:glycosyltransferase involved in cell wall biosynthesis
VTRIAFINQDRGIGPERAKGAAVHLRAMREAFGQLGCQVVSFDEHQPELLLQSLAEPHVKPFDLVYERYALGQAAGARFAAGAGLPYVVEVNAPLAEEAARYRGVEESSHDRSCDSVVFGQANCVLAVSSEVGDYAVRRGACPEAVLIRHNGIDVDRFNPGISGLPFRERHGLTGQFVLGFHGRERPWHGFGQLVEVVIDLLDQGLETTLVAVGEGEFSALGRLPPKRYRRLGWQDHADIPGIVAAFDVLPLTYPKDAPSYFSPLKLSEAMACGVVPVVPDRGDLPSLVADGISGLHYPPGDLARLAELLARLAADPHERRELGRGAASAARQRDWKGIATTILDRTLGGKHLRGTGS